MCLSCFEAPESTRLGKFGTCLACIRASTIGTLGSWSALAGLHWLPLGPMARAVVWTAAVAFTAHLVVHGIAFAVRAITTRSGALESRAPGRRAFIATLLKGAAAAGLVAIFRPAANLRAEEDPERSDPGTRAKAVLDWFKSHPEARKAVLAARGLSAEDVADLMLERPQEYVGIVRSLVEEVRREKAPADVVETVQAALRAMQRGSHNLGRYGYARNVLRTLRRTRDPAELDAALAKAINKAPDAENKKVLETMRRKIDAGGGVVIGTPGGHCHICCVVGCVLCGLDECAFCCFIGCLICNIVLPL